MNRNTLAETIATVERQMDDCAWTPFLSSGRVEYDDLHEYLAELRGKRDAIALREKNRVTGRNFMRAR